MTLEFGLLEIKINENFCIIITIIHLFMDTEHSPKYMGIKVYQRVPSDIKVFLLEQY